MLKKEHMGTTSFTTSKLSELPDFGWGHPYVFYKAQSFLHFVFLVGSEVFLGWDMQALVAKQVCLVTEGHLENIPTWNN